MLNPLLPTVTDGKIITSEHPIGKFNNVPQSQEERVKIDEQRNHIGNALTDPDRLQEIYEEQERARNRYRPDEKIVEQSEVISGLSKTFGSGFFAKLKSVLDKSLKGNTTDIDRIMAMNTEEQIKARAERINTFGWNSNSTTDITSTGMKGTAAYIKRLFQNGRGIDSNKNLLQDVQLTPGFTGESAINFDKILGEIHKALDKGMFKAQTGGGTIRNFVGAATGYLGMPSLEKSRAQVEALNQIMADVRQALSDLVNSVKDDEMTLAGLQKTGLAHFDDKGNIIEETSSAESIKVFADLEEHKQLLALALSEVNMIDQAVADTNGNVGEIFKRISFLTPGLMKDNVIIQNIRAGLDKNGKAFKFQSRTAEVLNYTFQLMSRAVGQTFKSLMSMINPLNLIKKAFSDFMGYNIKWQRTMNVIKYNLRTVLRPYMDWIAQKLVNIIGFVDIISRKVQSALGKVPISLFDQAAAQTEKMHEELEAAANVTAGFDELHDIGSSNSAADDLMGEIYTPKLSQNWIDLANKIGDLFSGVIKGDLGFGEAMKIILKIAAQGVKTLWQEIVWPAIKKLGAYIVDNWGDLLGDLLVIFLGWKLLKTAGKLVWDSIFGKLTGSAVGSLLSNIAKDGGLIGMIKNGGASAGDVWGAAFMTAAGAALAGLSIYTGLKNSISTGQYNAGVNSVGGTNQKSNTGNTILSSLGTGLGLGEMTYGLTGNGFIAAIVAAIATVGDAMANIITPKIQSITAEMKSLKGELQSSDYYQGIVDSYSEKIDVFSQQLSLLKQSIADSTQSIYDQGEKLGISKDRMDQLIQSTANGTFTINMLTGSETQLADSLTNLTQQQEHAKGVSEKLEEAQRKLLKAQSDVAIAQDAAAGNYEVAAARIEVAEAQGVYSEEEATKKRIQLYRQCNDEQRKNLLEDLTPEQRTRMMQLNNVTKNELGDLAKIWDKSSEDTKNALLDGVSDDVINQYEKQLKSLDSVVSQHQNSYWSTVGDTFLEILSFGLADTWSFNGEDKYYKQAAEDIKKNPDHKNNYDEATLKELKKRKLIPGYAIGTNYVPNDGLAYLHQGEAVIPKKYNQPYQPSDNSGLEAAINTLSMQVAEIGSQVSQGINVKGEFRQRGSDLVAVVQKGQNRNGNQPLSNPAFAR